MKNDKKILGLFPELGGGIRKLKGVGQHNRLIGYYFKHYAESFDDIYYFSYFNEKLEDYTNDPIILSKVHLFPKNSRIPNFLYTFIISFLYREKMQQCYMLRVFQITGIIPALITKLIFHIPCVTTYGYRYPEFAKIDGSRIKAVLLMLLEYLSLRLADGIIVTTKELEDYILKKANRRKIHYIPNGVDIELFAPPQNKRLKQPNKLIFVGRLEKQKNLFGLLEALNIVNKHIPVKITLIGVGTLKAEISKFAKEHEVDIDFKGLILHEELPNHLNNADVFVLPSFIEGNPKVLLEAMSCGLPCVVSNCEGNRTLVEDGKTGLLFNPYNVEDIAEKIQKVLSDGELGGTLGKNAREHMVKNFDIHFLLKKEIEALKVPT